MSTRRDNDNFDMRMLMAFNPDRSAMSLSPVFSSNIRNVFYRLPKKEVDGVWMVDISVDVMRDMIDYVVSQAIMDRRVSCEDFDKKFGVNQHDSNE